MLLATIGKLSYGLLAAICGLLLVDLFVRGPRPRRRPAGNDELPAPQLQDVPATLVCCDEPYVPLDELVPARHCGVAGCSILIPAGRTYCAIHEAIRREVRDGDYPELAAAAEQDVRAFAAVCGSN